MHTARLPTGQGGAVRQVTATTRTAALVDQLLEGRARARSRLISLQENTAAATLKAHDQTLSVIVILYPLYPVLLLFLLTITSACLLNVWQVASSGVAGRGR